MTGVEAIYNPGRYHKLQLLRLREIWLRDFLCDPDDFLMRHYLYPQRPELTEAEKQKLDEIYDEFEEHRLWQCLQADVCPGKPFLLLHINELPSPSSFSFNLLDIQNDLFPLFEAPDESFAHYFGETITRSSDCGDIEEFCPDMLKRGTVLTEEDHRRLSNLDDKTSYCYYSYQQFKNDFMIMILEDYPQLLPPWYEGLEVHHKYLPDYYDQIQYYQLVDTAVIKGPIEEYPDKKAVWISQINTEYSTGFNDILMLIDKQEKIEPELLAEELLLPGKAEFFLENCLEHADSATASYFCYNARELRYRLQRGRKNLTNFNGYRPKVINNQQLLIRAVYLLGIYRLKQLIKKGKTICFMAGPLPWCSSTRFWRLSTEHVNYLLSERPCYRCGTAITGKSNIGPMGIGEWMLGYHYMKVSPWEFCEACEETDQVYCQLKRELDLTTYYGEQLSTADGNLAQQVLLIIAQQSELLLHRITKR